MKKLIDVSQWQGVIDWPKVAAAVDGVIIKATEGSGFVDPKWKANRDGARAAGVPFGAYHFARPESDAVAQAEHFYRTAGDCPLGLVLDLEPERGERAQVAAWALAFLARLEKLSGRVPIVYTGAYVPFDRRPEFLRYPLWLAAYTPAPIACAPWGMSWSVWQYTSTGRVPGIAGNVDTNQARDEWFVAALGGSTSSTPTPQPEKKEDESLMVTPEDEKKIAALLAPVLARIDALEKIITSRGNYRARDERDGAVWLVAGDVKRLVPNPSIDDVLKTFLPERTVGAATLDALPSEPWVA